MTSRLPVRAGLELPDLSADDDLQTILSAALNRRPFPRCHADVPATPFWSAAHFDLDRVSLFRESSEAEQAGILKACSAHLLEESYYIEKSGLAFTAKMVLLSETTQERMLYGLFAADEATHLHQVESYLAAPPQAAGANPFLQLIAEIIETGGKPGLTYLIQVVLEGWGVGHYRAIAHDCRDESLGLTLKQIVKDEALHHGSGVMLFNRTPVSAADQGHIIEILVRLFSMVQAGPQSVIAALEGVKGHLSKAQRIKAFTEIGCQAQSARRIEILKSLMTGGSSSPILRSLEAKGVFRPFTPEECARA